MNYAEYNRNKLIINSSSMGLKGKIRLIEEEEFNLNYILGAAIKGARKSKRSYFFLENGYLDRIEWYASKTSYGKEYFSHDIKSQILITKTKMRIDTNGIFDIEQETYYKYDNNYNILERLDKYSGNFHNKLFFNPQGLLVKLDKYNEYKGEKKLEESTEYKYKENVLVQTSTTHFNDYKQNRIYISNFKYDSFYNLVEELIVESGENDLIFSYENQYDFNKNWVESKHFAKQKGIKSGNSIYKRNIIYF